MSFLIDTNVLVDKVSALLQVLEKRGVVYFFAFAEREDIDRWDVVLASEWSDKDSVAAVRFVAEELRRNLQPEEMTLISRIAVIPSSDPKLRLLLERFAPIGPKDNLVMNSGTLPDGLLGSKVGFVFVFRVQRPPASMPS